MGIREDILEVLWNPPTTSYDSSGGGTCIIDTDREALAYQILAILGLTAAELSELKKGGRRT